MSPADITFAQELIAYWVSFVRVGQPKHLQARALAYLGSLHVEQCANRAAGRSQRFNYYQRELLGAGTGGRKEQMQFRRRVGRTARKLGRM